VSVSAISKGQRSAIVPAAGDQEQIREGPERVPTDWSDRRAGNLAQAKTDSPRSHRTSERGQSTSCPVGQGV